jgi:hypothetical protein
MGTKQREGLMTVVIRDALAGVLRSAMVALFAAGCAGAAKPGDKASWKEEISLHDDTRLLLDRSQIRGGRHELGQEVPIAQHSVSFSIPGSNRVVTWKTEYGLEIEKSSLVLLALDVVRGEPYIVTYPAGCIAYNKWNRPNPPYVFFRFDGNTWQRVDVASFPSEINHANVVVNTQQDERRLVADPHVVSPEEVRQLNETRNPELQYLRVFVRQPIKTALTVTCPKMVYDGKGGWQSEGGPKAPY